MATSKVTLWNMAAGIVGGNAKGLILSEDSEGSLADHCLMFWDEAVDLSVEFVRPSRAKKYLNIPQTSDTVAKADWEYAFAIPADYVDLIQYTDVNDHTVNIEHEIIGNYIVSNEEDCYLYYLKKIDYTVMNPSLRKLVAANLAVLIAPFIKPTMLSIAEAKLSVAEQRALDMEEDKEYVEEETPIDEIV